MGENINIDELQRNNPWIIDDIKVMMGNFYKEGIKTAFEGANLHNSVQFFNETYHNGWSECIIAHRNGCMGCISFNNYDNWIKKEHPELVPTLFYPDKSQSEREWKSK